MSIFNAKNTGKINNNNILARYNNSVYNEYLEQKTQESVDKSLIKNNDTKTISRSASSFGTVYDLTQGNLNIRNSQKLSMVFNIGSRNASSSFDTKDTIAFVGFNIDKSDCETGQMVEPISKKCVSQYHLSPQPNFKKPIQINFNNLKKQIQEQKDTTHDLRFVFSDY